MNSEMALLLVDIQVDFCSGGALGVPYGDAIVEPVNALIERFRSWEGRIFATWDWHPRDHCSFKEYGGIWPPHCIRETEGAGFHRLLNIDASLDIIISKEESSLKEYSGFDVEELSRLLLERGVRTLVVCGLAGECIRPVDPKEGAKAIEEMRGRGAGVVESKTLLL